MAWRCVSFAAAPVSGANDAHGGDQYCHLTKDGGVEEGAEDSSDDEEHTLRIVERGLSLKRGAASGSW